VPQDLKALVTQIAERARAAALQLAVAPTGERNAALMQIADGIDRSHEALMAANRRDLESAAAKALGAAELDRITLNPARLRHCPDLGAVGAAAKKIIYPDGDVVDIVCIT